LIKGQSWVAADRSEDIDPADVTPDQTVYHASTGALACDVKFDGEKLSQLDSPDAIAAAVERNRG
jgi:hypothetical protein